MIVETTPPNAAYRLALILQAIKDKETYLAQIASECRNELKNLHTELDRLKMEILTGQTSLIDAWQAEHGAGHEVEHAEPMSKENGRE